MFRGKQYSSAIDSYTRRGSRKGPMKLESHLALYLEHRLAQLDAGKVKKRTVITEERQIRVFLTPYLDRYADELEARDFVYLLQNYANGKVIKHNKPTKYNRKNITLHAVFGAVKRFWKWLERKRVVTTAALRDDLVLQVLESRPKPRKGIVKPQLRVDSARSLIKVLRPEAEREPRGPALPALLALYMGFRAGEALGLLAEHVDDNGRLLWIEDAKTPEGNRAVPVPEELQTLLLCASKGLRGAERLFHCSYASFHHHLKRYCRAAGVREVGPHGLRRTYATLAKNEAQALGMLNSAIAKSLGHLSYDGMTQKHYVAPGTDQVISLAQVRERLKA